MLRFAHRIVGVVANWGVLQQHAGNNAQRDFQRLAKIAHNVATTLRSPSVVRKGSQWSRVNANS